MLESGVSSIFERHFDQLQVRFSKNLPGLPPRRPSGKRCVNLSGCQLKLTASLLRPWKPAIDTSRDRTSRAEASDRTTTNHRPFLPNMHCRLDLDCDQRHVSIEHADDVEGTCGDLLGDDYRDVFVLGVPLPFDVPILDGRSEEHTSELQSHSDLV